MSEAGPTQECPACLGTGRIRSDAERGAKARELRLLVGLSMDVVAKRMGISRSYLVLLELGRRRWSSALLDANMEALETMASSPEGEKQAERLRTCGER